ncbi:hypothetical protein BT96DRAFT_924102 [Gymnopus androsaceus JB14]|uniref:Uncharacterized protein n=1 Tax=Gymnopus androsaceus JB14 TaxID=1447944 RepID=A0A6A4H6G4_9AGAR|nr:hypothetical protein BT96DRAFT_924102 [Gymnopus androsaceus JB14]
MLDHNHLYPQDAFPTTNASSTDGSMNSWNQSALGTANSPPAIRYAPPPYPPPGYNVSSVNAQSGYVGQERRFAHGSIQSPDNNYRTLTSATALASSYNHQRQGMDDQFESEVMNWSETGFNGGRGA